MASYFVLSPTFLTTRGSGHGPRTCQVGETIEFDGKPGSSLYPLCPEARAARQRVLKGRNADQRARDDMWAKRWRRQLPKHQRRRLDEAAAEAAGEAT